MPRTEVVFYLEDDQVLILKWLRKLPAKVQDKCLAYLAQLEDSGYELRRPVADLLRDGIHELRPSCQGVHYRILYFFPKRGQSRAAEPRKIVVVSHGLVKEGAVPDAEIDRAIARKKRFEAAPEAHTFRPVLER